ncbi:MAG TPA: efflux RND transporter permease subunit [Blastocatellia bacterium]|nr:efflux RND transporter permease subunit [Blastocatellia bacterium]
MTLAELCVKRPVFAVMLISFLVVLGVFSFRDLGVDLFPKADPATVTINVRLPGATSEEVTTQVVLPLEESVSTISGLDELNSQASEGSARITCKFFLEREIESAAQDVREKVAGALRNLPPNILPPIIQKADPDSDPVISLVVAGDKSLRETTEIADKQIKRVLETVDGVGEVSMTGARERQIRIYADAEKLNAHNLTISQLEQAIQNENVEIPGGRIIRGESEMGVRTLGRIDAISEFGDIIVANVNGTPIRVNDVGRVEDSFAEPRTWNSIDGKQAVSLDVRRQSGTNTVKIIDAVKTKLGQIQRTLPQGVSVRIIRDQSVFINASVASLEEHLLFGSLLASLVVLLFIRNLRSVIIAAVAIPTSIIATFTLLKAMDFTLNNMTLLALTLAVGIVIDDAIVVLENIVRYIEEKHYEPKLAAIEATKEITLAVVATTISLVIIFVPIAFMNGYARRYVNQFGWTMAFSVMVSMLVSFTLTPMLSSKMLKRLARKAEDRESTMEDSAGPILDHPSSGPDSPAPAPQHAHTSKDSRFFGWIDRLYGRLLEWSLDHRAVVIAVALATFALTFPLNAAVGRDWIPPDDQSEFQVSMNWPEGTSIEGTSKMALEITDKIKQILEVDFVNPYIHEGTSSHNHIYVRLVDVSQRKISNLEVAAKVRMITAEYKNLRSKIIIPSALGGGELYFPVRALILGPDFLKAAELSKDVADRMRKIPGLLDVEASLNLNNPELQVKIDRQRASDLGVRAADVASAVRLMISGEDQISTYKEGDEQYQVTMQLLPEQQRDREVLSRLMIPSSKVGQVRLDNLATIEHGLGPSRIERFNRQFQVSVNANNAPDFALDVAARTVGDEIRKVGLPAGYTYRFIGSVKILDETTSNLILAFLLASIFMYMVLAAQFESFLHPFTIMLSLPLSIPFALLSLWLTGRTLNLWSALGVLLLLGIVKKNGILQVDYTNKLRREGVPLREAIVQANHVRLRPILMTTLSIIAGLIPTAIGIGAGSAQRSAIAVTIIGGQSLCLVLTLLVTPVAYSMFAELEEKRFFASAKSRLKRLRLSVSRLFTFLIR